MNEKQKQDYTYDIVSSVIPKQDSYSFEEVKYLVNNVAVWASLQIEHAVAQTKKEDVDEFVANCVFENIEEALKENEEFWEEEMLSTGEFIKEYFSI